jgi:diadenosine tetraphosphate (Ap4A) HIT family hydrolase
MSVKSIVTRTAKNVQYDADNNIVSCLFCQICKDESPRTVYYEDNRYIVFSNIRPAAPCHLLVIPKTHYRNINELESIGNSVHPMAVVPAGATEEKEHIRVLKEMKHYGNLGFQNWLTENQSKGSLSVEIFHKDMPVKYCFHVPPYNSVDHIHMHIIAGPSISWQKSLIYNDRYTFWCHSYETVLGNFMKNLTK